MTDRPRIPRKWRLVGLVVALLCLAVIAVGVWWIIRLDPAWLRGLG